MELEKCLYKKFADIALTVYFVIGESEDEFLSVKLDKNICLILGKTEDVFEIAWENTMKHFKAEILCWTPHVKPVEITAENIEKHLWNNTLTISNNRMLNGATSIFCPGVAKKLGELLGDDYYIAFTSIHEAMIHKMSDMNWNCVKESLTTVNRENTPDDILSNKVFYYIRRTGEFKVAMEEISCEVCQDKEVGNSLFFNDRP